MFWNAKRLGALLAVGCVLAAGASASTDPDFGDLSSADLPRAALSELKGPDLLPALGAEYRPLALLGALQALDDAVRSGKRIPREVQDALQAHADTWRAAYADQLAGAEDFDAAVAAALDEQGQDGPSRVAAYGTVSRQLQALADASIRYNLALSLSRFPVGEGYRTTDPRPAGTVGLDAAQNRQLVEGYSLNLVSEIQAKGREIQAILKS